MDFKALGQQIKTAGPLDWMDQNPRAARAIVGGLGGAGFGYLAQPLNNKRLSPRERMELEAAGYDVGEDEDIPAWQQALMFGGLGAGGVAGAELLGKHFADEKIKAGYDPFKGT